MMQILFYISVIVVLVMGVALVAISLKYQQFLKEYFVLKEKLAKEKTERKVLEKAGRSLEIGIEKLIEKEMLATDQTLAQVSKEVRASTAKTLQRQLQKRVDEEFAKAVAEIEVYKRGKITEVDQGINKVVVATTRKVLGEAIDTQKHEELILKALASAKQENVF